MLRRLFLLDATSHTVLLERFYGPEERDPRRNSWLRRVSREVRAAAPAPERLVCLDSELACYVVEGDVAVLLSSTRDSAAQLAALAHRLLALVRTQARAHSLASELPLLTLLLDLGLPGGNAYSTNWSVLARAMLDLAPDTVTLDSLQRVDAEHARIDMAASSASASSKRRALARKAPRDKSPSSSVIEDSSPARNRSMSVIPLDKAKK